MNTLSATQWKQSEFQVSSETSIVKVTNSLYFPTLSNYTFLFRYIIIRIELVFISFVVMCEKVAISYARPSIIICWFVWKEKKIIQFSIEYGGRRVFSLTNKNPCWLMLHNGMIKPSNTRFCGNFGKKIHFK